MTRIREFRISNLAGRPGEVHRVLDPNVNIFWGLNGTGKTTLLRILDAALGNKTRTLHSLPFASAEVVFYSAARDVEFVRRFDRHNAIAAKGSTERDWALFADPDPEEDVDYRPGQRPSDPGWESIALGELKDSDTLHASYRRSYLPISRMLEPVVSDTTGVNSSAEARFVRRVKQVWSRYSAKSLAEVRDIQQLGLAEILAILFGGTAQSPALAGMEGAGKEPETEAAEAYRIVSDFLRAQRIWLPLGEMDFTARYEESDQHRHVVTRIRSVMKQVDEVLAPQHELQSVIDEMFIGNKHLVLNRGAGPRNIGVEIGDDSIPLDALSSGEKQLLQILLETLAIGESTIMIDEPELSLHPDWQRGLVASMRRVNANAQFVLATHSPELMVGVRDECVFEL